MEKCRGRDHHAGPRLQPHGPTQGAGSGVDSRVHRETSLSVTCGDISLKTDVSEPGSGLSCGGSGEIGVVGCIGDWYSCEGGGVWRTGLFLDPPPSPPVVMLAGRPGVSCSVLCEQACVGRRPAIAWGTFRRIGNHSQGQLWQLCAFYQSGDVGLWGWWGNRPRRPSHPHCCSHATTRFSTMLSRTRSVVISRTGARHSGHLCANTLGHGGAQQCGTGSISKASQSRRISSCGDAIIRSAGFTHYTRPD